MANTWQKIVGGAAMAITLLAANQVAANQAGTIVLHVQDHAGVPPALLAAAQAHVSAVYEAVGVAVVWVNGTGSEGLQHGNALHRNVIFLSKQMTEKKCRAESISNHVLGRASHATKRAYIFIERIMDQAVRSGVDSVGVVGTVVAHEVGHLVLPEYSHAETGIMAANLDLRSRVRAGFTQAQAETIRDAVAAALATQ